MKNTDKVVIWTPYNDPITPKKWKKHPLDGDGDEPFFNQFESEEEESESGSPNFGNMGDKVIMTEIGPMGVNRRSLVTSQISMWICQTNFTITHKHVMGIHLIPGVEILKPLTRYKFLVGFGSLFDCAKIKKKINAKLIKNQPPYFKLDNFAKKKFKHYAILVDGESTYELVGAETLIDVEKKISELGEGWKVCTKC